MNHKLIIQKTALSALLLAAVASPATVNAADTPLRSPASLTLTAPAPTASAVASSTTAVNALKPFADPAELAKTYAPDTVEDWTATLARYKEEAGKFKSAAPVVYQIEMIDKNMIIQSSSAAGSARPSLIPGAGALPIIVQAVNTTDWGTSVSGTVTIAPSVQLMELPLKGEGLSLALPAPVQISIIEAIPAGSDQVQAVKAIPVPAIESELFKAQLELSQAVESEDVESIKQSLAKLLEVYKDQIKLWEEAAE
ncbi:MAG: hypothetical protein K0R57_3499 [Paenibacillaceae bacterium]|jgi:hypothetical protein|nr:hypothetical protein [Paenibacillaceae bacterium]